MEGIDVRDIFSSRDIGQANVKYEFIMKVETYFMHHKFQALMFKLALWEALVSLNANNFSKEVKRFLYKNKLIDFINYTESI